jgi:hypothetical protein
MAALVKGINAKIRSNPAVSYVCSTRRFSFHNICCSVYWVDWGLWKVKGKLQQGCSVRVWIERGERNCVFGYMLGERTSMAGPKCSDEDEDGQSLTDAHHRFLGSSIQLRNSYCSCYGHTEESRIVCFPLYPLSSTIASRPIAFLLF